MNKLAPQMSWGNSYSPVGIVPPPHRLTPKLPYADGIDFDAIFRQLVACYNALTELERQRDLDLNLLLAKIARRDAKVVRSDVTSRRWRRRRKKAA